MRPDSETIQITVDRYYVVEIDNGIKPAFFYKTGKGYELLALFDAEAARKNIKEE